jgi:hypothetical protein
MELQPETFLADVAASSKVIHAIITVVMPK